MLHIFSCQSTLPLCSHSLHCHHWIPCAWSLLDQLLWCCLCTCYAIKLWVLKQLTTRYHLRSPCGMMHPHVAKICSSQMLAASGGEWEIKAGGPAQGTRSEGPDTTGNHFGKMCEGLVLIIVIETWPIFYSGASFRTQGLRPQVSTWGPGESALYFFFPFFWPLFERHVLCTCWTPKQMFLRTLAFARHPKAGDKIGKLSAIRLELVYGELHLCLRKSICLGFCWSRGDEPTGQDAQVSIPYCHLLPFLSCSSTSSRCSWAHDVGFFWPKKIGPQNDLYSFWCPLHK